MKFLDFGFVFIDQYFAFHENLVFVLCFRLFGFLSINNYVYLSLGSFLSFEPILFMFWLQNRYKSSILKPKNQFYLFFWLQSRYKSCTFKPKNRLGPESESTSGCTGSLKIYESQPEPDRTRTGLEQNFHIIQMGLILINPKTQNLIGIN